MPFWHSNGNILVLPLCIHSSPICMWTLNRMMSAKSFCAYVDFQYAVPLSRWYFDNINKSNDLTQNPNHDFLRRWSNGEGARILHSWFGQDFPEKHIPTSCEGTLLWLNFDWINWDGKVWSAFSFFVGLLDSIKYYFFLSYVLSVDSRFPFYIFWLLTSTINKPVANVKCCQLRRPWA